MEGCNPSRLGAIPRSVSNVEPEPGRRCDAGCGRRAFLLLPALDLAFCSKHVEHYEAARVEDMILVEFYTVR